MEQKHLKICLVSFFWHKAFFIPLSNIREIIGEISADYHSIIVVSPELSDIMIFDSEKDDIITYKNQVNPLLRIINYFFLNLKISWSILKKSKDIGTYLFFSETGLILPMIIAKFCNKKIIWLIPSSMKIMVEHNIDFLDFFLIPLHTLSYTIADKIVLFSLNIIKEWKLHKYSNKILIARGDFINFDIFTTTIPLLDRNPMIGYIGRLSEEKGVLNFVQALPGILNDRKDLRVIIVGDGNLKENIKECLQEERLTDRVKLAGWISHDDLPYYLNQFKLLVIPSYTESGPIILIEAMACGTPVLATPVGIIPDFIRDGGTGFIMENNSPSCIGKNIIRALEDQNLGRIAINANKIVKQECTFESVVEQWKRIFD